MGPRGTMGDGRAEKAEARKERVTGCNNNIKKKGGGGPLVDERGGGGGILWMEDGTKEKN